MLRGGHDLERWITESGLVQNRAVVTAEQLERAVAAREAIFGLIRSLIDGKRPRPEDRILVNEVATHPRPTLQLTASGAVHRQGNMDAVLAVLAQDCLSLFDSPDRYSLRWCADPRCTRPFVDRSRSQRRRWCDMKSCGDKAKAAAYRQRHQSDASGQ